MIIVSHLFKKHLWLVYTQIFCITFISALIQWSIGSMHGSGLVILWSFLGPLGALIFLTNREAVLWMIIFVVIVIISAVYDPVLLGDPLEVTGRKRTVFYIMNIGASLSIVFITSLWFVSTIQFERGRVQDLLNKIRVIFGQHVSQAVVNEIISNENQVLQSKSMDVSIMFLDIRDFTKFADSKAPSEVAKFQNTVFSELINLVKENAGTVIQILGDGIYAVFGAPVSNDSHVNDAIVSGYQILDKIEEMSGKGLIPKIKIGIGVHSGNVVAGELGNDFRKSYSLAGSNVIIAARLEQLNKELNSQFLISGITKGKSNLKEDQLINHGFKTLKGIRKKINVYQLK